MQLVGARWCSTNHARWLSPPGMEDRKCIYTRRLLGYGGSHRVGLPLGVPTFLVFSVWPAVLTQLNIYTVLNAYVGPRTSVRNVYAGRMLAPVSHTEEA